jgi:hypothetical protein
LFCLKYNIIIRTNVFAVEVHIIFKSRNTLKQKHASPQQSGGAKSDVTFYDSININYFLEAIKFPLSSTDTPGGNEIEIVKV